MIRNILRNYPKFYACVRGKFELPSEDEVIRDFEKEAHTLFNTEELIKQEDREKDIDLTL